MAQNRISLVRERGVWYVKSEGTVAETESVEHALKIARFMRGNILAS